MLCGSNKCAPSPIVVDIRNNLSSSRRYTEYRVFQLSRSAARKCLPIIVIFFNTANFQKLDTYRDRASLWNRVVCDVCPITVVGHLNFPWQPRDFLLCSNWVTGIVIWYSALILNAQYENISTSCLWDVIYVFCLNLNGVGQPCDDVHCRRRRGTRRCHNAQFSACFRPSAWFRQPPASVLGDWGIFIKRFLVDANV